MPYETLIYQKEDGTAIITLNRPERLNALSYQLMAELEQVADDISEAGEVRAVILTGAGRGFCAGADLKERSDPGVKQPIRKRYTVFHKIEDLDKPVIAAINGVAIGGGLELTLVCDFRIASDLARLGLGEIKLGVIPAGGGTQRLPRLIGAARAKRLLFFGDHIDAQEALRIGLVDEVVPAEELMPRAKQMAKELAERPPLALKIAKSCVNLGLQMDLAAALDYEAKCASILVASEDRIEGMRAFLEKRKPVFKGK